MDAKGFGMAIEAIKTCFERIMDDQRQAILEAIENSEQEKISIPATIKFHIDGDNIEGSVRVSFAPNRIIDSSKFQHNIRQGNLDFDAEIQKPEKKKRGRKPKMPVEVGIHEVGAGAAA